MNIQHITEVEVPSAEEVLEMVEVVAELREEVAHYRAVAGGIDDEVERNSEDRYLSLDDLPYGEEMIRTRSLPDKLVHAAGLLERIADNAMPIAKVAESFQRVQEIADDARSTLDDCTSLPPEDGDEDDD